MRSICAWSREPRGPYMQCLLLNKRLVSIIRSAIESLAFVQAACGGRLVQCTIPRWLKTEVKLSLRLQSRTALTVATGSPLDFFRGSILPRHLDSIGECEAPKSGTVMDDGLLQNHGHTFKPRKGSTLQRGVSLACSTRGQCEMDDLAYPDHINESCQARLSRPMPFD
jgi:hypothetical protein